MVSSRKVLVSALAVAVPISAELTPTQIVHGIKSFMKNNQELLGLVKSVNAHSSTLSTVGQGPFPVCFIAAHPFSL
jgi:hypothetical protein